MPEPNRDFDLDDAFKHTQFVPDSSFKDALRGRLNDVRKSSKKSAFSANGSRKLLFAQTKPRETYVGHTLQPTARLIPAFGAFILIALIGVLIIGVLPDGMITGYAPIEPTLTATPSPTAGAAIVTADDLPDITGVWSRQDGSRPQMMQFNLDGSVSIDWAMEQNGDFVEVITTSADWADTRFAYEFVVWFEDGLLNVQNNGGWHNQREEPYLAQFEVQITMDGDTPVSVSFVPANNEAQLMPAWKDQAWEWVGAVAPEE